MPEIRPAHTLRRLRLCSLWAAGVVLVVLCLQQTWLLPSLSEIKNDARALESVSELRHRLTHADGILRDPSRPKRVRSAAVQSVQVSSKSLLGELVSWGYSDLPEFRSSFQQLERALRPLADLEENPRDLFETAHIFNRANESLRKASAFFRSHSEDHVQVVRTRGWEFLAICLGLLVTLGLGGILPMIRRLRGEVEHIEARYLAEQQAREAIDREHRTIEALMAASLDPLFILNTDGVILRMSSSVAFVFGYASEELIGTHLIDLFPESEHESLIRFYRGESREKYAEKFEWIREIEAHHRNGAAMRCQLKLTRSETQDGIRFFGLVRDVSGERERERKLERQNRELEEARATAERASRGKSAFLTNVSHELRTPLTRLVGHAERLEEMVSAESSFRDTAHHLVESSAELAVVVGDLLELSRIEMAEVSPYPEPTCLSRLLERVCSTHRMRAEEKGLEFQIEIDARVPEVVEIDRSIFDRALGHLLSNAVKFTESGSVHLTVRPSSDGGPHAVAFRIVDTGVGLDPAIADSIFEAFEQGDGSLTRRHGGAGLGLTIASRLSRVLGGHTSLVRSDYQVGTQFQIALPLPATDRPATDLPGRTDEVYELPEKPLTGRNILIVEDTEETRNLFAVTLEKAGATVALAENGREALERAEEFSPEEFDWIVMDVQMPVLDGLGATRHLRRRGYRGWILALTAHSEGEERPRCLEAGCDDFETKPITPKKLVERLAVGLMQREMASGRDRIVSA